jgi:hypothetical protein
MVSINGQVPFKDSLRAQQEADALVLFLWTDPKERREERGVYTGKLFEYIGARRPILAIGSMQTVASDLIAERGLGVVCETAMQVARQLQRWLAEKKTKGCVSVPALEAGAGLTREAQTKRLEAFLFEVVPQTIVSKTM